MPVTDVRDPAILKFLTECYEKENKRRLAWARKHPIPKSVELKREPKNYVDTDLTAHIVKEGMAGLKRDFMSSTRNRLQVRPNDGQVQGIERVRHGHSIVDVGLGNPEEDPRLIRKDDVHFSDPIMRPVDPKDKQLLYQQEPARTEYLHKRYKIAPEDRYYFTECNSWTYGWRLKETPNLRGPKYPKYEQLMRTLRMRVGSTPDPPHYKSLHPDPYCP